MWLALVVILLVIEAATVNLVTIWFAAGALGALIAALCGGPMWLQLALLVIISAVCLFFTRPLVKKYVAAKTQATNADTVFEKPAVVTEDIDNTAGTGAVKVAGKIWTARSADCIKITAGTEVKAVRIEGVKLIVVPVNK